MKPHVAVNEVDLLIEFQLQIDDAASPEARNGRACLRVEGNQPVAGCHVQDPFLFAVALVRQPAPRELPGCRFTAFSLVLAVHPQHLAGGGIERHSGAHTFFDLERFVKRGYRE